MLGTASRLAALVVSIRLLAMPATALDLTVQEGPTEVFSWARDRCETWHIPDAPARAFRTPEGEIRLIAAHVRNRVMHGPHEGACFVSAGVIELDMEASPNSVRVLVSAHKDSARLLRVLANQAELEITAGDVPDARGLKKGFMVKLTPVWNDKTPVLAYVSSVRVGGVDSLRVGVVLFSQDFGRSVYQVHYEISRYQPFEAQ